MEKGVVPVFVGGLGNQMFQLVAGYIVSQVKGCSLYICKWTNNNNHHSARVYTDTIFKEFGEIIPYENDRGELNYILSQYGYKEHDGFSLHTGYKSWSPEVVHIPVKMISYYQYYPPIAQFEAQIRNLFLKGLSEFLPNQFIQSIDPTTSAFLHIRRGDYLTVSHDFYTIGMDYYKKAVDLLKQTQLSLKTIYVLSDDPLWVKEQTLFQDSIFKIVEGLDELESMTLMSQCKAGAICANSTFSWWGAFLGAFGVHSPVFYPEKWVKNNSPYERNLFPKEWIAL
jgi:hypothetical protein